ncbi:MAG TPA: hypothetical protein GXX28_04200 [Firmicutes bacterium]|nr:hypothetical protein [Bacillota bacterium]
MKALNVVGLSLSTFASVMLFIGSATLEYEYTTIDGVSPREMRYKCRRRIGKWIGFPCLIAGFLLQLIAAVYS